ncbi:hypothetical protein OTC26_019640 [Streptomyces tirandamycinicus]|uniref:hypothetical protein n=1 Tax=Streptomyces tirandamycinicus TaxID=2174846 RepID=UPI00226DDC58|nr:hypothetical protein [Streptomyces tirandamycinicus]MCY0984928.1 hypothetical protein [Streptomyces tirandamycinicus]
MPGKDTISTLDRCFGAMEATPVTIGQILHRFVFKNSSKGKESANLQVDLNAWIRQAQRGDCDPDEAYDIFSLSAAHWGFLAAFGIMSGMLLDYLFGISFDLILTFSLSAFPAFGLLSVADAVRARLARDADKTKKRASKRSKKIHKYHPITHRRIIPIAASVSLLTAWTALLFTG